MKFIDVCGEHVAVTCDECREKVFKPNPVYRFGNKVLCETCLKERTALHWWDMEDKEYDTLQLN